MPVTVAAVASSAARAASARGSREGASLYDTLARMPPALRWECLRELDAAEQRQVFISSLRDAGSAYALFRDDPAAFGRIVLRQSFYSRQREALAALGRSRRVAVPSAYATGKTFVAAAAVLWMASCWPVGTSMGLTTATRFRQVKRQVWPEIRMLHRLAGLPGVVDTAALKMPSRDGEGMETVAYGLTVPANDESAAQGIHARGALLLVVDEAGGISKLVGRSFRGLLTGPHTHMLAIGNPPTDDDASWFQELCTSRGVVVIPIPFSATPNFSGERTGRCHACPPEVAPHGVASHLVDPAWEEEVRRDYGTDSAYYQAKALARFVRVAVRTTIPSTWVDNSLEFAQAGTGQAITVRDRLTGQPAAAQPYPGAWVRLGVDVAADGGDELVIARSEGRISRIVHISSGPDNAHPMNVAGDIAQAVREAHDLRRALGTPNSPDWALRVKIDVIGVGWNVWGILDAWVAEGILPGPTVIVPVDVREGIEEARRRRAETSRMRPALKRDELWLAGREDLQPNGTTPEGQPGSPEVILDVDPRSAAQLTWPDYATDSRSLTKIESKDSMRRRGLGSPDRAEALLLARYEPTDQLVPRRSRLIIAGA